jgi:glycosyltransferase involved in cell wall biosynthesis
MNIVIFADGIPPEGKGGAERIAWQSALALASAGHELSIITTTQAISAKNTGISTIDGIRIFSIPSRYHTRWRACRSLYNPGPVREVKKILAELKPDIVHAHNIHTHLSYEVLSAARACGARVFHTIHDVMPFHYGKLDSFIDAKNPVCKSTWNYRVSAWDQLKEYRFRYNPFRNFYIRHKLRFAHVTFAVSDALRDALAQNGIRGVEVLHNGIDASAWNIPPAVREAFVAMHNLTQKRVILFGGRISGMKGGDALLAALPEIARAVPTVVLLLMGTENEYVRKLKEKAEVLGVGDRIVCTGWITGDELAAAYQAASVVVGPSICFDSLSTIVLEAMACGKPAIGSCFGGFPEMIDDGVTGYTVHPLATEVMTERCVELLTDTEKATKFGIAGAKRQSEEFSAEIQTKKLIARYDAELHRQ